MKHVLELIKKWKLEQKQYDYPVLGTYAEGALDKLRECRLDLQDAILLDKADQPE